MENVWEGFSEVEKVLDNVAGYWCKRAPGRFSFDELKNECVIVYTEITPDARAQCMSQSHYIKYLWRSCCNRVCTLLRKEKIFFCIDDLFVLADGKAFREMMYKFWLEHVSTILSVDGLEVLHVVLKETEALEAFHDERIKDRKYATRLSREDVYLYLQEVKGWGHGRITQGIAEVRASMSEGMCIA